jgi:hypothetical protein
MKLCINLNEEVKFILTDKGLDIWTKYLQDLKESFSIQSNFSLQFDIDQQMNFLYKAHQNKELVSIQLHLFMKIFGHHMALGSAPPIKDLDIFLELK